MPFFMPVAGVEPAPCCQEQILSFPRNSELDGHKVVLKVGGALRKISPDKRKTQKSPKILVVKSFTPVLIFLKSTSE